MAASEVTIVEFDPLTVAIAAVLLIVAGYVVLRIYRSATKGKVTDDKRGMLKQLFDFNRLPTVPTLRIVPLGNGQVGIEVGKRARLRENSLKDSLDSKGWDIQGGPIPIIEGKSMELGYITHPAGCTLDFRPEVKIIKSDDEGNPVYELVPEVDEAGNTVYVSEGQPKTTQKPVYITGNYEGVIGTGSDLDDFNESTEREVSRNWIVPLLVGIIAGVIFFAPLFAWLMSFAAGAGK